MQHMQLKTHKQRAYSCFQIISNLTQKGPQRGSWCHMVLIDQDLCM